MACVYDFFKAVFLPSLCMFKIFQIFGEYANIMTSQWRHTKMVGTYFNINE